LIKFLFNILIEYKFNLIYLAYLLFSFLSFFSLFFSSLVEIIILGVLPSAPVVALILKEITVQNKIDDSLL